MNDTLLIVLLLIVPCAGGAICAVLPGPRRILAAMCATVGIWALTAIAVCFRTFSSGALQAAEGVFYLDALSAYHLCVMMLVFAAASVFAFGYFSDEFEAGRVAQRGLRQYAGLWCGALAAMTLSLISNNLGIMWVGIEATTLLTAFLICIPKEARFPRGDVEIPDDLLSRGRICFPGNPDYRNFLGRHSPGSFQNASLDAAAEPGVRT